MYKKDDVLLCVYTGKRYIVDDVGYGKETVSFKLKLYGKHQDELEIDGKVIGTIGTTLLRKKNNYKDDPDYIIDLAWKRFKKLGQFYNV